MRDGQGQEDIAHDIQVQNLERQSAYQGASPDYSQSALKAAEVALRVAQEDIEQLKAELAQRRHEFETIQSTLWQREEEIAQTRTSLDMERHNAMQADMDRSVLDGQLNALEKKLKEANEWVFRLAGERKAAEDKAARAEARLVDAEKTSTYISARLSDIKNDQKKRLREEADLRQEKEELAKMTESLRLDVEKAALRLVQSQSEIVTLSKLLRQREGELAPTRLPDGQMQDGLTQAHFAETKILSNMLQNSQAEADRIARRNEWLQKVNAVVTGYPHWWAFVPKHWRLRWQQGRLLRKGLFDADAYLARYPDVSASGMDPLRHYIIHGINENRSF